MIFVSHAAVFVHGTGDVCVLSFSLRSDMKTLLTAEQLVTYRASAEGNLLPN